MRPVLLILFAVTLSGCTVFKETLVPKLDLKSPCACAEDAAPVNDPKEIERLMQGVA